MAVLDSVKKIVYGALKNEFKEFRIVRTVYIVSEDEPWKAGENVSNEYKCLGLKSNYKNYEIDGEKILKDDCKITILGQSIPSEVGEIDIKTDTVKDPRTNRVWKIESVKIDPAEATLRCQCR